MGLLDLAEQLSADRSAGFEVWPDNMAIVDAWMAVCSQWNVVSMANGQVLWLGLDYAGAKVSLDQAAMVLTPEQWSGLRLMERVAGAALNGR